MHSLRNAQVRRLVADIFSYAYLMRGGLPFWAAGRRRHDVLFSRRSTRIRLCTPQLGRISPCPSWNVALRLAITLCPLK